MGLLSEKKLTEIFQFNNENKKKNFSVNASVKFLRNYTIEGIEPYLRYLCYSRGIELDLTFGDYNVFIPEILQNTSTKCDLHVLTFTEDEFLHGIGNADFDKESVIGEVQLIVETLLEQSQGIIVMNTLPSTLYTETGIGNFQGGAGFKSDVVEEINVVIKALYQKNLDRVHLIDFNRILQRVGRDGYDLKNYYSKKAPWSKSFYEVYAGELSKVIFALKGRNRKCVVLDCDNTLWKGVIGEDGMEGIKMSPNSYPGVVYHEFQKYILQLHDNGVIVTLCSKNNEEDVMQVLDEHPDCLIKREHLADFRVNWNNKASNIEEMVSDLNIGIDSVVFVDDSHTECELVRSHVPEVEVFQVPERIQDYVVGFAELGLFDTLQVSAEDKVRNSLYQQESKRKVSQRKFKDLTEFYKSLSIELEIGEASESQVSRVAQLTQKTNQFNLTTKRYSEGNIRSMMESENQKVYYLSAKDKFGELGITGICLVQINEGNMEFDSFLLSCRILGRNIERAFVYHIIDDLFEKTKGKTLRAKYIPTRKNKQTENFWESFGFSVEEETESGDKLYLYDSGKQKREDLSYIKIN